MWPPVPPPAKRMVGGWAERVGGVGVIRDDPCVGVVLCV